MESVFAFAQCFHTSMSSRQFGYVLLALDAEKSKEVLKKWKSKKVSDDIRIHLFNFIMTKCNIKAINLEDDVGLPLHVPMPRLSNQQSNNRSYVQ